MPIYLTPNYSHNPKGPDGNGLNRLRVDHLEPLAQCALKPKTYSALKECQNTEKSLYGPYEQCTNNGDCKNCAFFNSKNESNLEKPVFANEFYIRELGFGGNPCSVNKIEKGWKSTSYWGFKWTDVNCDPDFYPHEFGYDKHSRWVLMKRKPDAHLPEGV